MHIAVRKPQLLREAAEEEEEKEMRVAKQLSKTAKTQESKHALLQWFADLLGLRIATVIIFVIPLYSMAYAEQSSQMSHWCALRHVANTTT